MLLLGSWIASAIGGFQSISLIFHNAGWGVLYVSMREGRSGSSSQYLISFFSPSLFSLSQRTRLLGCLGFIPRSCGVASRGVEYCKKIYPGLLVLIGGQSALMQRKKNQRVWLLF